MFFLGCLALVQCCILPGLLLVKAMDVREGVLGTAVLSFATSLTLNYALINILVGLGIYNRVAIYIIFVLELALLLRSFRPVLSVPMNVFAGEQLRRISDELRILGIDRSSAGMVRSVIMVSVAGVVGYFAYCFLREFGTIFSIWDDVVSWNHWATEWFHNGFPTGTHQYPQLLPAIWSMTYVFMGDSTLQFFSKGMMPLFPLGILCAMVGLGIRYHRLGYMLAALCTALILNEVMGRFLFEGFADIPVAFMAFASISLILSCNAATAPAERFKRLVLGAIVAIGCAHTKQVGMYIAAFYPVLAYLLVVEDDKKVRLKTAVRLALFIFAFVAPWYLLKELEIYFGTDTSNLHQLVVDVHHGRNAEERVFAAFDLLNSMIPPIVMYVLLPAGLLMSLRDRQWRWITMIVTVPFFLTWLFLFSYDQRNLSLALPFVGGAVGIGLETLLSAQHPLWSTRAIVEIRRLACVLVRKPLYLGLSIIFLSALLLNIPYHDARLIAKQRLEQTTIGEPEVNEAVYREYEKMPGTIITNYDMLAMGALPKLEKSAYANSFTDLNQLKAQIKATRARYLLERTDIVHNKQINDFLNEKVDSGEYVELYRKKTIGRKFVLLRLR